MSNKDNIIKKQSEMLEQVSSRFKNGKFIPQPERDIEWETMRNTYEISKSDVLDMKDPEGFKRFLEDKKQNRDLSSYTKELMINDFENKSKIEDGTDRMIEVFLDKLSQSGLSLVETDTKKEIEKEVGDSTMKSILSNEDLKNKLKNIG